MPDVTGMKITVTDELGDSGAAIMAIANQIGEQLATLARQIDPLREWWTGGANQNWQDIQTMWNAASNDLMAAPGQLGDISRAAATNWTNYVDCETANINSWQH